jgi:Trypsin-like peptidase domain
MFFGQTWLSIGTGFVWKDEEQFLLITNWHNVTGIDPFSGKHLSNTAAEPDRIQVWWNRKGRLGKRIPTVEVLRDINGSPLWWIHPEHGHQIDVIALPINPHADAEMYPINAMPNEPLLLVVGTDVFVLGYPFEIGLGAIPIWKRGSIASEPEIFSANQRHIFIDTASRPGMSGSPIIRRSWGTHFYEDGSTKSETGSIATRFVGVYSGRMASSDPLDAQLGLAWPAALVTEIIAGEKLDT